MSARKKPGRPGAIETVVDFFASIRLTLFLIAALALISFFGTTGRDFSHAIGSATELHLDFRDVYGGPVYRFLLGLLFINLLICSASRLPTAWRRLLMDSRPTPPPPPRKADHVFVFEAAGAEDALARAERALFGAKGWKRGLAAVKVASPGDPTRPGFIMAPISFRATGLVSILGPYVTHLGILLIIVGGIWGSLGTFEAYLALTPGEASSVVERTLRQRSRSPRGIVYLQPAGAPPLDEPAPSPIKEELGFAIKCNDFQVSFYENSGMARDYVADLSIVENGAEMSRQKIEVNRPLHYRGYGIYQSSYGVDPQRAKVKVLARYLGRPEKAGPAGAARGATAGLAAGETASPAVGDSVGAKPAEVQAPSLNPGDTVGFELDLTASYPVPGEAGASWSLLEYQPSRSAMGRDLGPSVTIVKSRDGKEVDGAMLFENFPNFDLQRGGEWYLSFKTAAVGYYTGLQIIKDPGLPLIWLGFGLLVLGVVASFIVHHHRFWLVALDRGGGRRELRLIGRSRKAKFIFEQRLEALARRLKQELG